MHKLFTCVAFFVGFISTNSLWAAGASTLIKNQVVEVITSDVQGMQPALYLVDNATGESTHERCFLVNDSKVKILDASSSQPQALVQVIQSNSYKGCDKDLKGWVRVQDVRDWQLQALKRDGLTTD